MKIRYRKGYKYQLAKEAGFYIPELRGCKPYNDDRFLSLVEGWLVIRPGYAWDGASGPTWDSPSSMAASLVHDALYQLIRSKHLNLSHRELADNILHALLIEGGMWKIRAWLWVKLAKKFAEGAATKKPREIIEA